MESMTDWAFSCPISGVALAGLSFEVVLGWMGRRTLVVFQNVSEMVTSGVMRLAHAHRVVREVYIAVVAYIRIETSVSGDVTPEVMAG